MELPPPYPGTPQGKQRSARLYTIQIMHGCVGGGDPTVSGATLQPSAPPSLPAYEPPPYDPQGLYPSQNHGPYSQPGATRPSPQPQQRGVYNQTATAPALQPLEEPWTRDQPQASRPSPQPQQRVGATASPMAHPALAVPAVPTAPFGYEIMV